MARDLRRVDPPPYLDPPRRVEGSDSPYPTVRLYSVGFCWYASPRPDGGWWMYPDGPEVDRIRIEVAAEHRYERPVIVVLPSRAFFSGIPWCVHSPVLRETGYLPTGWRVTGSIDADPIDLTVQPSIDYGGHWHGYLTRGWLEDVAG
jgi:hypothetical protein